MMKIISTFGLCLLLMACQTTPKQSPVSQEIWQELQEVTVSQLREKSFGEAADSLEKAMSLAGEDSKRWEYIRMGLVSLPPDLALPLAEQALKLRYIKKSDEEMFGFSKVYTQLRQLEPALSSINQAIDIKHKEDYVFWRARLYLMLQKHVLAEKDYLWLLDKDNNKEEYISQYASLLTHIGRSEDAETLLDQHKNNPQLLYKSILLALREDDEADALLKFNQLKLVLDPETMDEEHKLEIGELASWMKDWDYSLSLLSTVISGDKSSQAKLIMGRVLMSQENYDRAIIMFRQAQNGIKEHAILAYLLEADAHSKLEEPRITLRTLTQALSIFPDNSDLLYSRAMAYESQKELEKMEDDLQAIIDQDDQHYDALNALGYSWADRNIKLVEAYDLIKRALDIRPDNIAILDSMGWVLFRQGEYEKARIYLEKATENQPEDKLLYEHLLDVLVALEDHEAITKLKDIIQTQFSEQGVKD